MDRMSTANGRRVLASRRAKGRKNYLYQTNLVIRNNFNNFLDGAFMAPFFLYFSVILCPRIKKLNQFL